MHPQKDEFAESLIDRHFLETFFEGDDLQPQFLGSILIAGSIFYLGMKVGGPAQDIAKSIEEMNQTVRQVGDKIVQVLSKLDQVLDEIRRLPKAIQGILIENEFRENLLEARVFIADLTDYSSDQGEWERRLANGDVDRLLAQLRLRITKIFAYGGTSGFLQSSYIFASYAQCYMLFLRQYKTLPTIWDSAFTKQIVEPNCSVLMKDINRELEIADNDSTRYPTTEYLYRFESRGFKRTNIRRAQQYDASLDLSGHYEFRPFVGANPIELHVLRKQDGYWKSDNWPSCEMFLKPPICEEWSKVLPRSREIMELRSNRENIRKFEKTVMDSFIKPDEWKQR